MALIPCQECKREVSTEAKTCPNCGAKVKKPKKPMPRNMKILLGILGVAFIVSDSLETDKNKEAEKQRIAAMTPEQKAADEKRLAQQAMAAEVAKRLKNAMKDPQAFVLTSLVVMPNGAACYEYRAKNSFGAILPSKAVLSSEGKILLKERDRNLFVSVWNEECTPAGGDEIVDIVKSMLK